MKRKSIFAGVIAILLAMGCGSITANNQESPAEDSSNEINSDKPLEQTSSLETSEDVSESKETEESTSAEDQSKDSIKEKKMEVVEFKRDGKKIYGELYKPEGEGPFPCVIIAHGFGGEDWKNASQAALEFIKTHCSEKD